MKKAGNFLIAIGILAVVAGVAVSAALYGIKGCRNLECYQDTFSKCARSVYIYDNADEATWKYEILGDTIDGCKIRVSLMQAKKGDLSMESLKGLSMDCTLQNNQFSFPEGELKKCTGKLREELQSILIDKLYRYIIPNIGTIAENIDEVAYG